MQNPLDCDGRVKQYPSISRDIIRGVPFYIFDKLDGSNVRAEWDAKKGFWKFGTRQRLMGPDDPIGKFAIPLIQAQSDALSAIFKSMREREVVCFFEFWGPKSFAGLHDDSDVHQVHLIDVSIHRKGLMLPAAFVKTFEGKIPTAALLHRGNITKELVELVQTGTLDGMTFEGVVCKGAPLKNGYPPHMIKIKNLAWIEKVKALYTDPKVLEELL